jgi:hypothetical protein
MGHLLYADVPKVIRMWNRTSAQSRTRERERERERASASEETKQRDEALDRRIRVRV